MNQKQPYFLNKQQQINVAYMASVALFIGLICSKFLISLSMITLLLTGLCSISSRNIWAAFRDYKAFIAPIGIFLLFLISALCSTNMAAGWERIRIALPLLALPIAFMLLPPFPKRHYQELLSLYSYAMLVACTGVLINYWINYEEIQQLLIISKAVPTPNGEHIRFSLMINLAIYALLGLYVQSFYWKWQWEKWLQLGLILFFIITLHLLSVRIGIVILYANLLLTVFYFIATQRRYWIGLVLIIGMLVSPYLAYQYIPSVRTKVDLTRHNLNLYQHGHIGEYSDTRRLLSYQIALDVSKKAPWIGVGIGDLEDEQAAIYAEKYPDQKVMKPHNMFLSLFVATGGIGLLFFIICLGVPLLYRQQYKDLFFLLFYTTIILSFMTENTLLTAIGVALYSFFLCFSMNAFRKEPIS